MNGALEALNTDTIEKYGYIIELLIKFPKLYEIIHTDYYKNGSKSGWSLNKVVYSVIVTS